MAITDADLTDLLPEIDVEALIGQCYTPFPSNVIKVRQDAGTGNKPLSYVGHPEYTRRLDALFPFAWDFRTEVVGMDRHNRCSQREPLHHPGRWQNDYQREFWQWIHQQGLPRW